MAKKTNGFPLDLCKVERPKPTKPKTVRKRAAKAQKPSPKPPVTREAVIRNESWDYERHKAKVAAKQNAASAAARDIGNIPFEDINWELRKNTKYDLRLWCETIFPEVFYLGWSQDQMVCIQRMQDVFLGGGRFALAMPRGGGKTALCRAAILWGTAHGHKRFPFFIGSKNDMAKQTLSFIQVHWLNNSRLADLFPEIGYPIERIEGRQGSARGQTHFGDPTHISWVAEEIAYPCIILSQEELDAYGEHDPDFLVKLPNNRGFSLKNSGIMIQTAGVDGTIRGVAEAHPFTLEQRRPDVALIDDVQSDQKADSPASCEKLVRLLDGAVDGLSGPDDTLSCLMPCTVIREGDVADTYLDHEKKPEWSGERFRMVNKWPEGITDFTMDPDYPGAKLWMEYDELRKRSFSLKNDLSMATEFYIENREEMDKGFEVSWDGRYNSKIGEVSAQQHAMNKRMANPHTFPAEYQNIGRQLIADHALLITADQLCRKVSPLQHLEAPTDARYAATWVDIQDEGLFYTTGVATQNMTIDVVDYSVFPKVSTKNFTKNQLGGWLLLSKLYFQKYPHEQAHCIPNKAGRKKAPLDPKLHHGLEKLMEHLSRTPIVRQDGHQTHMYPEIVAVDCRWGEITDTAKKFCYEARYTTPDGRPIRMIPYFGQHIAPTNKQYEEYNLIDTWLFEHQRHPLIKQCRWIIRVDPVGQPYMTADVSRLKDSLFKQLAIPQGKQGCIRLYNDVPHNHAMFANQVCNSEYPELVTARGIEKNQWMEREGRPDNEYLDGMAGLIALFSQQGAYLPDDGDPKPKNLPGSTRSLRKLYDKKRGRR